MKLAFFISLFIFFISSFTLAQENSNNAFDTVLKGEQVGKEIAFSKNKGDNYDSLVLVYLGKIKTTKGKSLKILSSRWYWGLSPRATSRIIVFNDKNQYLGDYYLTTTHDVPDRIEGTSLVFVNEKGSYCTPGLVTRINFGKGIPAQFFLKCKGSSGDIYSFSQNL